jgi:hypothetical protein
MRRRLAILTAALLVLVLLAPAGALAQDGNPFDGQLPPSQPTPAPTVEPVDDPNEGFGRETLWLIGGGVAIALLVFGVWITRDARSSLPRDEREERFRQRDEGPHKHERQAKQKARAKTRAQRQARKAHRKGKKARR